MFSFHKRKAKKHQKPQKTQNSQNLQDPQNPQNPNIQSTIQFQTAEGVDISGYIKEVNEDNNPCEGDSLFLKPSMCAKGSLLISDGFGPCQAVIVKLEDGRFALYHASGAQGAGGTFFDLFAKLMEGEKIEEMWVIEKASNDANLQKAPMLTERLGDYFKIPVNRLHVNMYETVICDQKNGVVTFLTDGVSDENGLINNSNQEGNEAQIDYKNPTRIEFKREKVEAGRDSKLNDGLVIMDKRSFEVNLNQQPRQKK